MNKVTVSLKNDSLDSESLANFSQEFIDFYLAETDIEAELQKVELDSTHKGEGINFVNIIITFISSGSAIALFEVFKAYLSKDKSMEFILTNEAGETIKLNANNLNSDQFDKVLDIIKSERKP